MLQQLSLKEGSLLTFFLVTLSVYIFTSSWMSEVILQIAPLAAKDSQLTLHEAISQFAQHVPIISLIVCPRFIGLHITHL